MSRHSNHTLFVLLLALLLALLTSKTISHAQTESAYDLIEAVNALRESLNLEPYQVDQWLMNYAP